MNETVSNNIADKIHSLSLTRAYCYLQNRVYLHCISYLDCFCFECQLMHLFCQLIVEIGDQKYFLDAILASHL